MSKLAIADKFIDFSDYGRPLARRFATSIKDTSWTPIHVTLLFGLSGLIAIICMLNGYFIVAGIFLILKSIIDAADGELSRINNTPSHSGRYLDSIFDIILNFLFIMTICFVSESTFGWAICAFLCIQLQGTLYNYYYVILRNRSVGGDITSKIFEHKAPKALGKEDQYHVDILFSIFYFLYGAFDKAICVLDAEAYKVKFFPNWFMTFVSLYGLGFQLLIISFMLSFGLINYIIPFFVGYSLLLFVFVGIRRIFLSGRYK